ncbi:4-hydroxythreonine-4-phosphate dehydrogenase PdxA [Gammaproteobacteria bacterium]|nr:4-hydroxythreonine-4-phosphate dehydrogenase PdxA [Gammaproteobacteria bacterium]
MKKIPKILITPGDPSGIGFDILLEISKKKFPAKIIAVTSINLLKERAKILKKSVVLTNVNLHDDNIPINRPGEILVHDIKHTKKVVIGSPSVKHAPLILKSLDIAIAACVNSKADAMVTGPVQKNILMEYGADFSGHTEYIAHRTGGTPIMMLHSKKLRIALLTTHIPLSKVTKSINKRRIETYIKIISKDLNNKFGIENPKIWLCGLNPHAGEDGYIGMEEKNIILPAIKTMRKQGYDIDGPYPADTIFTKKGADLILAMYHDQALPVIKTLGFGNIVNTTLGLPIIRTSVDHGTAVDIAGTNKADSGSLLSAIKTAIEIVKQKNAR